MTVVAVLVVAGRGGGSAGVEVVVAQAGVAAAAVAVAQFCLSGAPAVSTAVSIFVAGSVLFHTDT